MRRTDPEPVELYEDGVRGERAGREERLRDPMGWLSVVGLQWLEPGERRFGSDPEGEVVLASAAGVIAPHVGTLDVGPSGVSVHPQPGTGLMVDEAPVPDSLDLADDESEAPTILALASLRLVLIRRGGRRGLRVRDTAAPAIGAFAGLPYFQIDPRWRITGHLVPAQPGATIAIGDVLGSVSHDPSPGVVEFEVDGTPCRLHALEAMPGHLWLLFQDATSGHETYGGGRFLVSGEVAADGAVEIDFNLAYNPPCVFTPYATCPCRRPPIASRCASRPGSGCGRRTGRPAPEASRPGQRPGASRPPRPSRAPRSTSAPARGRAWRRSPSRSRCSPSSSLPRSGSPPSRSRRLAGVLLATALHMVEASSLAVPMRSTRGDAAALVITAGATIVLDLVTAVILGLIVANAFALQQMARSARMDEIELDHADHTAEEQARF